MSANENEFDISAEDKYQEPFEEAKSIVKLIAPELDLAFEKQDAWLFGRNKPGINVYGRLLVAVLKETYEVMTVEEYSDSHGRIRPEDLKLLHYRSGRMIDNTTKIYYAEAKYVASQESSNYDSCRENDEYWHFYNSDWPESDESVVVDKCSGVISYYCDIFSAYDNVSWHEINFIAGEDSNKEDSSSPILVQSFINNIAFPSSLKEVQEIMHYRGRYNAEDFECVDAIDWTVPKWCKAGDICFFMHGKSAIVRIRRLKRQLRQSRGRYSEAEYDNLERFLSHGEDLYEKYGGKIYAVGIVANKTYHLKSGQSGEDHWRGRIYATIGNIHLLVQPVHRDEISSFITISSAAAITPVFGEQFEKLLSMITERNATLPYIRRCKAMPLPLAKIDDSNWIELCNEYRREFILEYQFRSFYVDRLLKRLGDRAGFFSECPCYKDKTKPSFVDNVILFCGRYLPVECKISVSAEIDIREQVHKYCKLNKLVLNGDRSFIADLSDVYTDNVLIIDTDGIYLYDDNQYSLLQVISLEEIKDENDIIQLRATIAHLLDVDPGVRRIRKPTTVVFDS